VVRGAIALMRETLRDAVHLSRSSCGTQLNDTATGFAVDISLKDQALMDGSSPASIEFWRKLREMGLTSAISDLKEVRRLQRTSFRRSVPPFLDRLRDRLRTICRDVPFFSHRAESYDPSLLSDLEDFSKLPFMRKRDLRENFPEGLIPKYIDLNTGLANGSLTILATSGSTDERLQVITRSVIDRLPFGSDDLLGIEIGGFQPRTAFLMPPICSMVNCRLGFSTFEERRSRTSPDLILNSTNDPFAIDDELVNTFLGDIEKFQPKILAADPIYLQCITRIARQKDLQMPRLNLIQRGFEFGTMASIRDIEESFETSVLNDYGASEENRLAVQCHKKSLHVRADAIFLEIIDRHGPCPPGVVGAIAVTTFDTITPLVRYLIGDAAAWRSESCDCAFRNWPVIELHGRLKDMLLSNGRWTTTLEIDQAIQAPRWLDFYRLTQNNRDSYEMRIIPAVGHQADFDDVLSRIEKYIDIDKVRCRTVNRLDLSPSMKIPSTQTSLDTPELP
jgi:phenylacetate-CoA ligase